MPLRFISNWLSAARLPCKAPTGGEVFGVTELAMPLMLLESKDWPLSSIAGRRSSPGLFSFLLSWGCCESWSTECLVEVVDGRGIASTFRNFRVIAAVNATSRSQSFCNVILPPKSTRRYLCRVLKTSSCVRMMVLVAGCWSFVRQSISSWSASITVAGSNTPLSRAR